MTLHFNFDDLAIREPRKQRERRAPWSLALTVAATVASVLEPDRYSQDDSESKVVGRAATCNSGTAFGVIAATVSLMLRRKFQRFL